jgi:hypothetical protein
MSIFGWSLPPGCSRLPYDDDCQEECPMCGKPNCTDDGEPVFVASPDFCSKECDDEHARQVALEADNYAAALAEEDAIAAGLDALD